MNWLRWWDARRPHWVKAFKCDLSCPQTNLSEAVNASFTHRGSCQITLLRAAYEDTAESILVEKQYEQYKNGERTGGSGPSLASKAARETAKQKREAVRMVDEMELLYTGNCFGTEAVEKAFQDCAIDPTCSFEPPKRGKSRVGRPRKKHVSVYDDTDCDSSSSEESVNRASRTRKKPNKKFAKSLEKAVKQHKKIKAQNLMYDAKNKCFEVTLKSETSVISQGGRRTIWNTYKCSISKNPSCECAYFVSNKGQICKHIIWTMINLFGEDNKSTLLFQVALTDAEMEKLKSQVCSEIPASVLHSPQVQQGPRQHVIQQQPPIQQPSYPRAPIHQVPPPVQQQQLSRPQAPPVQVTPPVQQQQTSSQRPNARQSGNHFQPSRQPWHNNNPFVILNLSNQVKKCTGCPFALRDPLGPPFTGLVVQHKERDTYFDANAIQRVSSEANKYYHCQWGCLAARHPYISVSMIQPDPSLILDDFQKCSLFTLLGVSFQ